MPDLERALDKLAVDLQPTLELNKIEIAFQRGKTHARFEILVVFCIILFLVVLVII